MGATVEHLYVELRLHLIEHEIVVVDDGSTDGTWATLQQAMRRVPTLRPVQNTGEHGFGRAVSYGLDQAQGDAMVVMMADESDDCRDVVRYWEVLNEGWDAVFGSRFVRGGGVVDYPAAQADSESSGQSVLEDHFSRPAERFHECVQGLPPKGDRRLPAISVSALQPDHRDPAQDHCARLLLDRDTDHLAEPAVGRVQAQDPGDGQPLFVHRPVLLVGEVFLSRRLRKKNATWVVTNRAATVGPTRDTSEPRP